MHGGTQTIRFWGLQHVHWCEGSCCWFLRQPGRLVSGGYPGRRLVCSRASSIYIGLRCRFCEVHRRHLMHGGTQTIRFWGYNMSTGVKAHVAGSCGCKAGWFERWLSRPLIGLFPSIIYLCIGLRCRFCEVHRRHLMHGGTQTIRFWGLQHVHWCEGSCCWFLRLQSRLV